MKYCKRQLSSIMKILFIKNKGKRIKYNSVYITQIFELFSYANSNKGARYVKVTQLVIFFKQRKRE